MSFPLEIATRDGVKVLTEAGDGFTADMGSPRLLGETKVSVDDRSWPATHVDVGNPHAVAFVDDLADAGRLLDPPTHDEASTPTGSTSSSSYAAGSGTSRCGSTSAAPARPGPAAPAPAP